VVRTTIAGDGADAPHVAQAIRERGAANVAMIGTVPARDIPALYAASDIGAVLLRDLPLFEGALPTKLLEVMAAGRPVLLAARGESAALVASAGAGSSSHPRIRRRSPPPCAACTPNPSWSAAWAQPDAATPTRTSAPAGPPTRGSRRSATPSRDGAVAATTPA